MSQTRSSRARTTSPLVLLAGLLAVPTWAAAVPPDEQATNPDTTLSNVRTSTGVGCEHPSEHPPAQTSVEQRASSPCDHRATPDMAAPAARGGGPRSASSPRDGAAAATPATTTTTSTTTSTSTSNSRAVRHGAQPGTSPSMRQQPPARGGGPRSTPGRPDCGENEVGPDGNCVAPDLTPDAPQQMWDRDPRLPPPEQQNSGGPASPQAVAPRPDSAQ